MFLVAIALVLVLSVIPVKIGAHVVGARRTGFWACFAALVVAGLIGGWAVHAVRLGAALSVFASALGYMVILDTTYLRGLAIAVIQGVLTVLLVIALAATALAPFMHRLTYL